MSNIAKIARQVWSCMLLLTLLLLGAQTALAQGAPAADPLDQTPGLTFNHNTTQFQLTGAHITTACESCHRQGQFRGTPRDCAVCHATGDRASGKSVNHIPTRLACDNCHRTSGWNQTSFSHRPNQMEGDCTNCHTGQFQAAGASGKPVSHIPTTSSCTTCHSTTSWLPATNPHLNVVPGSCGNCHNGTKAKGKNATHIPVTGTGCDSCHNNFNAFAPAVMNHTGLTNCSSCHTGTYVAQNAQGKPLTHIQTNEQCSVCHSSTQTWMGASFSHTAASVGNCSTCHLRTANNTTGAVGMLAFGAHMPTTLQCDSCHNGYSSFAGARVNHALLANQCSNCHNGSFTAQNAKAKGGSHIITALNCDTCHTTVAWAPASNFAHQGVAAGTCDTCHGAGTATPKPAGHIPVGAVACDNCHKNYRAFAPAQMNHNGFVGQCDTCHNGSFILVNAQTKTPTHVATTEQCDYCHRSTTSWATVTYVHRPIDTACSGCHNGTQALGKSTNHIPTSNQCSVCHTNKVAFSPASMKHDSTTAGLCSNCHNGSFRFANAQAKSTAHIPVGSTECESCHNQLLTSFVPATMNHAGQTACSTCHSGAFKSVNALGKPLSHVDTTGHLECSDCHAGTSTWTVVTFAHPANAATYNGVGCISCHNGSTRGALSKPTNHIPVGSIGCQSCHTNFIAFKPAQMSHGALAGGTRCDGCHNGSYSFANAQTKPTSHIPVSATAFAQVPDCGTCHVNAQNSLTWAGGNMDHTGTAGKCATCHYGGYLAYNAQSKPTTHIATTATCDSAGCHVSAAANLTWAIASRTHQSSDAGRCSTCHNSINALGKPGTHIPTSAQCDICHNTTTFRPAMMNHTGLNGQCSSCHNGAFTFANALGKPATHIPTTAQCDTCHTSGFTLWKPAAMNHSGLNGQCSSCHSGTYLAQNAQSKPATHVPTTAQCDTCHNSTVSWATTTFNHGAVSPAVTGRCRDCHTPSAPAETKGLSMPTNHIPVAANVQCDTCHKNFVSFAPATMSHVGLTDCAGCHNGSYPTARGKPANHIPDSRQCSTCHVTTAWKPASNFSHVGLVGTCASCHNNAQAKGKPATHIPVSDSTADCNQCHATGTSFSPATMSHTNLTACSTCHSGSYQSVNAQGKPTWHIAYTPATQECSNCHNSRTTWATGTMNHAALSPAATGRCSTCHDAAATANKGLAKPTNHVPTSMQCDTCHTNYTAFSPAQMNHTGTAGQCANCHNGGYLFANALAKNATHLSTTAQCDLCHRSTTTWTGASFTHPADAGGRCASCHNGSTALGMNASTHIPTAGAANCDNCHISYTAFAPARMNHAGLTSSCATCHSGSYVSINAQKQTSGVHIPTGAVACNGCHVNGFVAWSPASMNHALVTPSTTCSTCHGGSYVSQNAQTKPATHVSYAGGTECNNSGCHSTSTSSWAINTINHAVLVPAATGRCSTCHDAAATANKGLSKPTNHIPTTAQCDTCHNNYTAFAPAAMNHSGMSGNCSTCHNGSYTAVNAQAKNASHIPTTQSCDTCHGTVAWKPTSYAHTGVVAGSCGTCHNGTNARGKPTTHVPVTLACDNCHKNYVAFAPAQMNHAGLAGQCASCHGGSYVGVNAQTKPTTHVVTSLQCDTCHSSTVSWAIAKYTHSASDTTCSNCHNGVNALGKPTNHVPTTGQCSTCHGNYVAFKPAAMNHDASVVGKCSTCHNGNYVFTNALAKTVGHIPVSNECDVCHTRGYVTWSPSVMNHTVLTSTCSTCHSGAYVSQNAQTKPATHVTYTAGTECNNSGCHASTSTWAISTINHAVLSPAATGRCSTCHDAAAPAASRGLSKPSNHIPTSAQCDTCHNNYIAFAPAVMNHSGTAGACQTCHGGGYTALNAQAKPATHIPTTQSCDSCHGTVTWKPTTFAHTGVVAGSCATCHNGTNARGKTATHIPVTQACDNCHKNYSAFAPAAMNHTGLTDCVSCHSGTYTGINAQAKPSTHVVTTAQCSTCHNSFTTWATGVYAHKASDTNCSSCHNGVNALGKPTNHIPTGAAQCSACHSNTASAFKPAQMNHSGLTSCSTCHNGSYTAAGAQARAATHIPITVECSVCHQYASITASTSWATVTMQHTNAGATNCLTCHSGSYVAQGALAKPTWHTVTTAQCNTCHSNNASNFSTWAMGTYTHTSANANQCNSAGCHNGSSPAMYKSASHVPTSLQCDQCHTASASRYLTATPTFNLTTMVHNSTTTPNGGCSTCHNGSYVGTGAQAKNGTHISTSQSCDVCHTYPNWKPSTFAHTATQVGTNTCATCHNGTTATGKPGTHVPTVAACNACHVNTSWTVTPQLFTHTVTQIGGYTCAQCHTGAYLGTTGKPASGHIPTNENCSGCHRNTAWTPLVTPYGHSTVAASTCGTCHIATYALMDYKPVGTHIPTGSAIQCDVCHLRTTWLITSAQFTHSTAQLGGQQCQTCHNGAYTSANAMGKTNGVHMPYVTSNDCNVCHNTTSFATYTKKTTALHVATILTLTPCTTCHDSTSAYNIGSGDKINRSGHHGATGKDCSSTGCHRPTGTIGSAYSKWN